MASGTLVFLNLSYNCVTLFTRTKLEVFAATTLVWEVAHIVDGYDAPVFLLNFSCTRQFFQSYTSYFQSTAPLWSCAALQKYYNGEILCYK